MDQETVMTQNILLIFLQSLGFGVCPFALYVEPKLLRISHKAFEIWPIVSTFYWARSVHFIHSRIHLFIMLGVCFIVVGSLVFVCLF